MFQLCLDCYFERPATPWKPLAEIPAPRRYYKVEYSDAWTNGDKMPGRCFVYILGLTDGDFYVGHTTDMRKRFAEHREAKIPSTAGRNPKLRYMEIVATQKSAELREDELKRLIETNPSQIHLMLNKFDEHMVKLELE